MAQDVYVDLLFLINFSMDYLCLYICAKIMKRKLTLGKLLISSSIGALYSVLSLFIPLSDLLFVAADILIGLLICAIAFHEKSRGVGSTLLCTFLFVGISMMTGGCMTAIFNLLNRLDLPLEGIEGDNISTYLFAIVAAIAGFVSLRSGQVISRRSSIGECMLEVTLGDKKITVNALSDSGNLVTEPFSALPVIIISSSALPNPYNNPEPTPK